MSKLSVYAKIIKYNGALSISSGKYNSYKAMVCDNVITVYISNKYGVLEEGQWVFSNSYFLTNDRTDANSRLVALRIEDMVMMDDGVVPEVEYVEVECSGTLLKPNHKYVQEIGKNKIPFMPCTLKLLNEDNSAYCVLLVCFNSNVKFVKSLDNRCEVCVRARIKKNKRDDLFELNVTRISKVKEANSNE